MGQSESLNHSTLPTSFHDRQKFHFPYKAVLLLPAGLIESLTLSSELQLAKFANFGICKAAAAKHIGFLSFVTFK